jgi:hypothetical protein
MDIAPFHIPRNTLYTTRGSSKVMTDLFSRLHNLPTLLISGSIIHECLSIPRRLLLRPHNLPLLPPIHINHLPMNMTAEVMTRQRQNSHSNSLDGNGLAESRL